MTVKHTPGPWVCTATSHHAHDYRLEIPHGQMPFERGANVEYANARLIAAAPDLLTELIAFIEGAEAMGWSTVRARAAINKATGEPT